MVLDYRKKWCQIGSFKMSDEEWFNKMIDWRFQWEIKSLALIWCSNCKYVEDKKKFIEKTTTGDG